MRKYLARLEATFEVGKVSHSVISGVTADQFDCGKEHACVDIL